MCVSSHMTSLGTVFLEREKKKPKYLAILCLKCHLHDINFLFEELLYRNKYHTHSRAVVLDISVAVITYSRVIFSPTTLLHV